MKMILRNPWFYRAIYLTGAIAITTAEFMAIFNHVSHDTITENVRGVLDIAPIIWWVLLGGTVGFGIWFERHMFWKKH